MTPNEFKAWFDGFTEAFSGTPTKAQWARIKARVAEIDGQPITERVFVDRWWPYYTSLAQYHQISPQFYPYWSCGSNLQQAQSANALQNTLNDGHAVYCSQAAMNAVGRAEALSLTQ